MNLSKSKYCKAIQCPKILWLDMYNPDVASDVHNSEVLDNGTKVGELAKNLFGFHFDVSFNENLNEMIKDTKALLLNKKVIITEASFNYNNNFCSVDILKKEDNNYEIYEVKSSTSIKDIYIEDLAYQTFILKSLGYNVTKSSLVYINSSYIREEELELDKFFKTEDYTNICLGKQDYIKGKIEEINKYCENHDEPFQDISINCFSPYECPYFNYCSGNLSEQSIFQVRSLPIKKKFEYYQKGLYKYQDLLQSDLKDKYKMQIEYEMFEKVDYINKDKIKEFLDTLSYPLYFLDFETFQTSIPEYIGTHPYEQIPFQYSIHYQNRENSELKHKEFLAESNIDPRRKLAESLIKDIPKNACVLAYNMSFEKSVIRMLADTYPDLKEDLLGIRSNIKDLMTVFYNKDYYSKDMHGSYSIKYVLPALFPDDPTLNYHNLELVHNGVEASASFLSLKEKSLEEQKEIRENLLKYCGLDTYAMVKILNKLKEVIMTEYSK